MATLTRRTCLMLMMSACIAGCASPQPGGPFFPGLETPPRVQGHLYVYRPPLWFTAGVKVPVRTGYVREGDLYDGSYLRIRLSPGWHIVEVNGITQRIHIAAGRNHFIEFDLSRSTEGIAALTSNTLATTLTERGVLHVRDEADAVPQLQGLRNAGSPGD